MRFVKNKEPIMSAATIAAFLLAVADRVFDLSDGDLALMGPVAIIIGGAIMRQLVYSPYSYFKALRGNRQDGDE